MLRGWRHVGSSSQHGLRASPACRRVAPCLLHCSHPLLSPLRRWLRFANNRLEGSLPLEYAQLAPHLVQLTLDNNNFKGKSCTVLGDAMCHLACVEPAALPQVAGIVPSGSAQSHASTCCMPGGSQLAIKP